MINNIGFCITGSFCTHEKILIQIEELVHAGYNVIPIITNSVKETNTRFGRAEEFLDNLESITGNAIIDSIVEAEPIGPKKMVDLIIIAPCTGNTLSKLASSQTDNAVTMATKSHLRNNKPVLIGISTNDGLGGSLYNIATLITQKNYYFIPFSQDDPLKKPKSLVAKWELIDECIKKIEKGEQLQPILQ